MTRFGVGWLVCALLSFAPAAPRADEIDVNELVRRAEDALRGKTAEMKMRMTITTPRWTRELVIRSWDDQAGDRSFSRVLEPPKDKGTGFLRDHDAFWTWLPKVERAMRIPPSMMLQPWMGSDFTNDDLVKESSLRKDFVARVDRRSESPAGWWLILEVKPGVVGRWARIDLLVGDDELPIEERHFDRKGRLARTMRFGEVRVLGGRRLPTRIALVPADKEGETTEMRYLEASFDVALPADTFSLSRLEQARPE